jgi:hypothetical protein
VYPWWAALPPLALVAIIPPSVQAAALAGSGANRRPTFASSALSWCSTAPACTVTVSAPTASTFRKWTLRSSATPLLSDSPLRPVPAPRAVTETACSWQ